jgi:hypothetical protein
MDLEAVSRIGGPVVGWINDLPGVGERRRMVRFA